MGDLTRLGSLVERGTLHLSDGYRTKASELGEQGIPVLRVSEVRDDSIQPSFADHVRFEFRRKMRGKTSCPNDVIVTTKGTVGRSALIHPNLPEFVYSPQLCVLRVLDVDAIDPRWLYAWVRSPEFQRQAQIAAGQTDMAPYVNLNDLRRMRITVPDLRTQRAVADVLATIDEKIAANARLVATTRELAQALILRAAAGENPRKVSDVAEIRKGLSYNGAGLGDSGKPMVNLGNAQELGWLKRSGFKHYNGSFKPRHVAQPGSLLVSGVDLTWNLRIAGWPMLLPEDVGEALFSHHVFLVDFAPEHEWLRLPLWAHLYTFDARSRLEGMMYGTTVATLPAEALTGMEFSAPSRDDPVMEAAETLLQRAWAAERESGALAALRDTLLPALVAGELRVRVAEAVMGEAL